MKIRIVYNIVGILFLGSVFAQVQECVLRGIVVDDTKQPLPFASISIENTSVGTNANEKGEFALKLNAGKYKIVVQYIGYKKKVLEVVLPLSQKLEILMQPEDINLKEVLITLKEDPAYEVIRKAIKTRKKHYQEVNSRAYSCDVYIKGVQKVLDIPEKVMGMEVKVGDNNERGIIYLSETKSRFYFSPPDKKKEIIKASRVSGESRGFSFNRYIPMQKNIYENHLDFYFIANKPFISPIAENALLFYRYKMRGTFFEDGKMINKIEVIPKSATEPCFRGFIYIEENSWRVHSFDFYITKEAKLNFIDTLWIKQMSAKIQDSIYYPNSIQYIFNFNIFGIKGAGYFIASVSDYNFSIDTISKKFFKNEMVKFEKEAIKNDSVFWNIVRPIPLSDEEKKDYIKKDSIERVKTSPAYLDSLDKKHNRFKLSKIFTGYYYQNSKKKFNFKVSGLVDAGIQYNTIEGVNIELKTNLYKQNEDETKKWYWHNAFRYGIANKLFGFKNEFTLKDNPFNFRRYSIYIQYYVEPFNHQYSIMEVVNTAYTLIDYRNYLKLYLKKSMEMSYHQEVLNGLYFTGRVNMEERSALENTHALKVFKHKNYFTSNNPQYPYNDSISFPAHQAVILNLNWEWCIKQRYTTYPDQKYVWQSKKYPIIRINYTKAIPLNKNMVNYDLLELLIDTKVNMNYWGGIQWNINGGYFLNSQKMYLMDYRHFAGNQTFILNNWNTFRMLNYFNYSTNNYFLQSHLEYNLKGLLIGKIPFVKKYKIEEVITAHYLHNNLISNYYEISFGLDKLFYLIRVEYALGYCALSPKPVEQFLIGINFLNKK